MRSRVAILLIMVAMSCSKDRTSQTVDPFRLEGVKVNGVAAGFEYADVGAQPDIELIFSSAVNRDAVSTGMQLRNPNDNQQVPFTVAYSNADKTVMITPGIALGSFSQYELQLTAQLASAAGQALQNAVSVKLTTRIDSADKFDRIPDEELLTLVQHQTFKYFWDFAHPVSGMARERNTSGNLVTTGGSGFGVMNIVLGISRDFITRQEGFDRVQKIVQFLKAADRFHGAFPHWLDGTTGRVQRFSDKDDGADLVETSLLMQGLLTARQYFDRAGEQTLRDDITALFEAVEWNFFRNGQQVLYWHWSPNYAWEVNLPISGWNESLITYVLAASSPTHPIARSVYDEGWARNGAMRNGNAYYGIMLPLGSEGGGPLFLSQYSFLGINPNGLTDAYANYEQQVRAHALVNRAHCVTNPHGYYGYSADCWGLTASDDINGYRVHSPTADNSVITPTAALSSFPYTPQESMQALQFFYYKLGDKIWGEYGFKDAFSLHEAWFADSYLAIDQGPIGIMIENHRTQLLWDLFMSAPEVKAGMRTLGFSGPHL